MLISIDLGYGYTKAVSEKGRVIFLSVIAPAHDAGLDFGKSYGHVLEFRKPTEMSNKRFFVGELVIKESRAAQITLSRERFHQESSVLLTLATAYLAGADRLTDHLLNRDVRHVTLSALRRDWASLRGWKLDGVVVLCPSPDALRAVETLSCDSVPSLLALPYPFGIETSDCVLAAYPTGVTATTCSASRVPATRATISGCNRRPTQQVPRPRHVASKTMPSPW